MVVFILLILSFPSAKSAFGQASQVPVDSAVQRSEETNAAAAESAKMANSGPEDFKVFTEHPRLLLPARRLRLLRRERERKSLRWDQLQTLITGKVDMPEKGFAYALYYIISLDEPYGKQAVTWALSPQATDLRQLSLVFDWCQGVLTESQSKLLAGKIASGLAKVGKQDTINAIRTRVLAAVAIADHVPGVSEPALKAVWNDWWMAKMVPALRKDRTSLAREDGYALLETMHVVRDNLNFDMRDNALAFFKDYPIHRVISYYPATFPASENIYRIPMYSGLGDPNLNDATLSRAADLSLVAFDTNALENQFVQGWLIQDRFVMRGTLGTPYEFLWANPYQPGLSYHHLPTYFQDTKSGVLYLRSDWEESATWLAYSKGEMELFMDGKRTGLQPRSIKEPLEIGTNIVMVGESPMQWTLNLPGQTRYFMLGFKPNTVYEMEVDDEELREVKTDAGGVISLSFPLSAGVGVRLHESTYAKNHKK